MKKNLYYRSVLQRTQLVKAFIIRLFIGIASWPRLLLEVFIRRNFGERYFSFSVAVVVGFFMFLLPIISFYGSNLFFRSYRSSESPFSDFLLSYTSWYLFVAGFLFMAYRRWQEVKRNPNAYDFSKFSLYQGDVNPRFLSIKLFGKEPSVRLVECLLEPAFFFAIGFVLVFAGQSIGNIIILCSIIYSLSYVASYYEGDEFVLNKIDEMICNEDLYDSFVLGKNDRGVLFRGRRPVDEADRSKVSETFFEEEKEEVFKAV